MTNKSRNQCGMTMVEVVIALGVGMVGMLGVMQLVEVSTRQQKNVSVSMDFNSIVSSLQLTLSNTEACTLAFKGGQAATGEAKIKLAGDIFGQGTEMMQWKIDSFKLTVPSPGTTGTPVDVGTAGGASKTLYLADIEMKATKVNKTLGAGQKTFTTKVSLVADGSTIESCYAENTAAALSCQALGGTLVYDAATKTNKCTYAGGLTASQNAQKQACVLLGGAGASYNAGTGKCTFGADNELKQQACSALDSSGSAGIVGGFCKAISLPGTIAGATLASAGGISSTGDLNVDGKIIAKGNISAGGPAATGGGGVAGPAPASESPAIPAGPDLSQMCAALGGVLDPSTSQCTFGGKTIQQLIAAGGGGASGSSGAAGSKANKQALYSCPVYGVAVSYNECNGQLQFKATCVHDNPGCSMCGTEKCTLVGYIDLATDGGGGAATLPPPPLAPPKAQGALVYKCPGCNTNNYKLGPSSDPGQMFLSFSATTQCCNSYDDENRCNGYDPVPCSVAGSINPP